MAMASIEANEVSRSPLGRPLRLCAGLGLLALAFFMGMSLASWNVSDPSLSLASADPVTNLAGPSGAIVADLAMQIFGLASVLLVVLPAIWAVTLISGRHIGQFGRRGWLAFGGIVLAAAALGCFPAAASWPLPIGLGGIAGDLVLKFPALITGAYPSGFLGLVFGVILAAPAGWLFLAGTGLIGAGSRNILTARNVAAPRPAERPQLRHAPAFDEEDEGEDERESRFQLMVGAASHLAYTARSALSRRFKREERFDRERTDPFGTHDWSPEAPLGAPAPAPRLRTEREVREVRIVAPQPPQPVFEPAPAPYAAYDGYEAEAAWQEASHADAYDGQAYDAYEPDVAPDAPARRAVDTSRATVRHGRSDWNGSVAASRLGQPRGQSARGTADEEVFETEEEAFDAYLGDEIGEEQPPFDVHEDDAGAYRDEPSEDRGFRLDAGDRIQPANAPAREETAGGWLGRAANIVAFPKRRDEAPASMPAPAMRAPQPQPQPQPQRPPAPVMDHGVRVVPAAAQQAVSRQASQPQRVYQGEPAHAYAPEFFELPPVNLLSPPKARTQDTSLSPEVLQENARLLEGVLDDFGVKGEIIEVRPGPVVTLYELEPAPGIKSSRVIGLADDIARSMSAIAARVAVIPGKNAIGIELPNARRETVYLREMIGAESFSQNKGKLALTLGKTIGGEPVIADLAKMPHLLVAGTTGSGKSVSINTMILSLLYRLTPAECRMIMIDPKMLELSVYDGIPHLLSPVVTDPKKAVVALKWTVKEMEDRYRKMSKVGVRNIDGFNTRVRQAIEKGETISRTVQTGFDRETGEPIFESEEFDLAPLPYIVVIIDEMADLMMVAGKEIEGTVQRLAQMARAAGIHVIMATQRPSVDVITGTIKANFPTRISFQVTSKIDSRTILQEQGAEQLLGQGDMLFMAGGGRIQRVHGPFVDDAEVEHIVAHLKSQGVPDYLDSILEDDEDGDAGASGSGGGSAGGLEDSADLYDQAVAVVLRDGKASTSYVQRRLGIGYNRAASLIERMENEGVIGAANHAGKREILVPTDNA
ncbi:DNA translocase FtsK [Aureimonas mangrovi]|uniref:DNA translocase FtsK n=1 Tax=Aureimonas mangrovi TaxID=2758041 RepID=UPI00163DBF9E|nr:DNA translocase FtsK [Aureimonas mangrovi]